MIRALVVDDETLSRDELKYLLEGQPGIGVCGEAVDGESALEQCSRLQPDVVFLDIQMPGMSGLKVAKKLVEQPDPPLVVFATAYDQYAIEAFELNAVDYLLKPFAGERLTRTVQRLKDNLLKKDALVERLEKLVAELENRTREHPMQVKLVAEQDGRLIPLCHRDIVYACVDGRCAVLKTRDCEHRSGYTMQELEEMLPGPPFFRCHRGYLVNLDWVQEVQPWFNGAYQLVMRDEQRSRVYVSRLKVKKLKELLNF